MKKESYHLWGLIGARPVFAVSVIFCCLGIGQPITVRADELTKMSNTSFALTVLDMATTRLSVAHTNGVETNPIARPFVRSDVGALGYAILTTAIERIIFRKHPRAFIGVDGVEAYAVVRNYTDRLRALNANSAAERSEADLHR